MKYLLLVCFYLFVQNVDSQVPVYVSLDIGWGGGTQYSEMPCSYRPNLNTPENDFIFDHDDCHLRFTNYPGTSFIAVRNGFQALLRTNIKLNTDILWSITPKIQFGPHIGLLNTGLHFNKSPALFFFPLSLGATGVFQMPKPKHHILTTVHTSYGLIIGGGTAHLGWLIGLNAKYGFEKFSIGLQVDAISGNNAITDYTFPILNFQSLALSATVSHYLSR